MDTGFSMVMDLYRRDDSLPTWLLAGLHDAPLPAFAGYAVSRETLRWKAHTNRSKENEASYGRLKTPKGGRHVQPKKINVINQLLSGKQR